MAPLRTVTVVTNDQGKVIATHQVLPGTAPGAVRSGLRAGPGQTLHEIEIEVPAKIATSEDVAPFHASVQAHLGTNKRL